MTTITIPERNVEAIDLMSETMAVLDIVHLAIAESNDLHHRNLASVLFEAIEKLQPVRRLVNEWHGRN